MILLVVPIYILNTEGSTFQKEHFVNYLSKFDSVCVAINYEKNQNIDLESIKRWKASSKISKIYVVSVSYKNIPREGKERIAHRFREYIENLRLPGSNYPYWKSIVYDEYMGSIQEIEFKVAEVIKEVNPSLIFMPLPSVINSTAIDDIFMEKLIYHAKNKNIKIVGFQYAPIIDKNFIHLYNAFDYFIVNSEAEKVFLTDIGIESSKIFIAMEKYTALWSRTSPPHTVSYWTGGKRWREDLGIKEDDFVIGSAHIFSHRRELMEIVSAFIELDGIKILINTSSKLNRRGFIDSVTAREYTLYKYKDLIGKKIILVEDKIMNVLYFSDILILPADLTYNILDTAKKPIVIYQKGLPSQIRYKNVVYTNSMEEVKSVVLNYIKEYSSLNRIMKLLTEVQTYNSNNYK